MKQILALLCVATLLGAVPPAAAEPEGIYADVIRMLEAELSEEVIVNWLEGDEREIPEASADDLIGLKAAGATDALLDKLLELSRRGTPPEAPKQAAPATPAEQGPEPPATPAVAPARSPDSLVSFRLAYVPPKVDFDDELWDLYVYLDGEPLAYVPPNTSFLDRGDALEFRQRLEPGTHRLVVTQEKHERQSRKKWRHSARVSAQAFDFEVEPGYDGEVELSYNEGLLGSSSGGPLTFRFLQADRVTEKESAGGRPESWRLVCEEIEANVAPGKKPGRSVESQLEGCVRWGELWEGGEGPSRDQIREALAAFDFRPVPRGS
jgi:hypothetical protein